jgi:hypothetical protein
MGNSTISLQNVIDFVSTIGDLAPSIPAGGFSNLLATEIANDVMSELLSNRFNWKFNRLVVPPFYTISWQQDYATIATKNIGWLEHAVAIDINNTALPKPIIPLEVVRDLELTSYSFGRPDKACWLPNDQLSQGVWPGAAKTYTQPLGAVQTPTNPPTNILDANGNILVLTTYGVTGNVAPVLPAASASGTTVNDGACVWTVADPKAQGFRLSPLMPQSGVVYQINIFAQAKPTRFTSLEQMLDPIPDDYSNWFKDGFIAYMKRHSTAPQVKAGFEAAKAAWIGAMMSAMRQGDRERDDACFVPTRGIMDNTSTGSAITAAWPYPPQY